MSSGKRKQKTVPEPFTAAPNKKQVVINSQQIDSSPTWKFSTVDKTGPFAWPKGNPEELRIVQRLHDFDSMKWKGGGGIEGKTHHYLSISSLSREAKAQLKKIRKDDEVDNLFSFHLSGSERVIGVRYGDTVSLLWFDPNHKVAPAKLKHT
jgi:hypothetical protein